MTVSEPLPEFPPTPVKRRDRLRAATTAEIIATARRLLLESGPQGISLRAIAREMGMTAPGLYRYFDDREELIQNVIADIFTEVGADIRRAIEQTTATGDDTAWLTAKVVAACHEFRRWSLTHHDEFALLFGVPLPGIDDGRDDIASACAMDFAGTFFGLFFELWTKVQFPVPAPHEIDPALRSQLSKYQEFLGTDLPTGAILTFLRCWMLLYGAVAMEVFGHMAFALDDPAPMFEYTLSDMARLVGLRYPLEG